MGSAGVSGRAGHRDKYEVGQQNGSWENRIQWVVVVQLAGRWWDCTKAVQLSWMILREGPLVLVGPFTTSDFRLASYALDLNSPTTPDVPIIDIGAE